MVEGKEYKKIFKSFEKGKGVCDRCGNDFGISGPFFVHLPYRKIYIKFCGICWNGLILGLHKDLVNSLKDLKL